MYDQLVRQHKVFEERDYTNEALDTLRQKMKSENQLLFDEIWWSKNMQVSVGDAMNVISRKTGKDIEEIKTQMKSKSYFYHLKEEGSLLIYFFIDDMENFIEIPKGYWGLKMEQSEIQ